MLGFSELVILFFLGFHSAQAGPPPDMDTIRANAIEQADITFYCNLESVLKPSMDTFKNLFREQLIQNSPNFKKEFAQTINALDRELEKIKQRTSINVMTDLHQVSVWFKADNSETEDFSVVIILKGNLGETFTTKMAEEFNLTGTSTVGDHTVYSEVKEYDPNADMYFSMVRVNQTTVMFGTKKALEARAKRNFKAPDKTEKNVPLDQLEASQTKNPFLFFSLTPGKEFSKLIDKDRPNKSVKDIFFNHDRGTIIFYPDGIDVNIKSHTDMYDRYLLLSEAVIDIFKSGQLLSMGFIKIMASVISPQDPELDKELAEIFTQRKALINLFEKYAGPGKFETVNSSDKSTNTIDFQLKAKHLREIIPVIPIAAFFFLAM